MVQVHGAVYVIDAADPARIEESKSVLHEALKDPLLADKPILMYVCGGLSFHLM